MRHLVRSEVGLVLVFAAGALVVYVGLALSISGRSHESRLAGWLVLLLGIWVMLAAPVVHDRLHAERGEATHALWGSGDRRKPRWWPGSP
jgi:hypothetical protein